MQAVLDTLLGFWREIEAVWTRGALGVPLDEVLLAVAVFFVFLFARRPVSRLVLFVLRRVARRTSTRIDDEMLDALELPVRFLVVVLGIYVASAVAPFPEDVDAVLTRLVRSLIAFLIFWTLYRTVDPITHLLDRATTLFGARGLRDSLRGFFAKVMKFAVACVGVVAILEEWEFNVGAVLGGLGLVGMAVAFGAQNLIANLFAGITIFLDHIFEKGEWIKSPDVEGVVEDIGFRATKIRRFDMSLVTIPNNKLVSEAVINFTRMTNRRIFWMIGVEYRTTEAQLRRIVQGISEYVYGNDAFETDPARVVTMVHVDSFNDSSIDILLYCFTRTTRWTEWMAAKEELAYRIKAVVEEAGAAFAFPSSSLYVEKLPFGKPEAFSLPAGPEESSEAAD